MRQLSFKDYIQGSKLKRLNVFKKNDDYQLNKIIK